MWQEIILLLFIKARIISIFLLRRTLQNFKFSLQKFHKNYTQQFGRRYWRFSIHSSFLNSPDKDRTPFSIGLCSQQNFSVRGGWFIIASWGVAIEITNNTLWFWEGGSVHGTSAMTSDDVCEIFIHISDFCSPTATLAFSRCQSDRPKPSKRLQNDVI